MHDVVIAKGDGIGPEIMEAVLHILSALGAPLNFHPICIGEKVYKEGHISGITEESWEILRKYRVFLKAPITTPQGGGFKSLNVSIRSGLGLFANIRPCISYAPFVSTKHPLMDLIVVRENEEDLYAGIEYQYSSHLTYSHKLISRPGSERIIRYAFEYAIQQGKKKVSCFIKDNIMKLSDGLFHQVFQQVALEYPHITAESWIVDIGAAKLADTPELFELIVMPNLYGDILSDVAAQISGSVGLAGSANIGIQGCMFEAIHGSAPKRAGQNVANPSGLLLASILMLAHLGENSLATTLHEAFLATLESGIHTYDIYRKETSKKKVGTQEFAQAVVEHLGKKPHNLKAPVYQKSFPLEKTSPHFFPQMQKTLVGIDITFLFSPSLDKLLSTIQKSIPSSWLLVALFNRGAHVWTCTQKNHKSSAFCTEEWRCRFGLHKQEALSYSNVLALLHHLQNAGMEILKTDNLYNFDGKPGFSGGELFLQALSIS